MTQQGKLTVRHPGAILLLLILLFLIPLGLAWLLYSQKDTLGEGMTNHGHLIKPPFSIADIKIYTTQGQLLNNQLQKHRSGQLYLHQPTTNGKWMMLYLYPGDCDKPCQRGLYNMRQIRLATGKNRDRVERAILTYRHNYSEITLNELLSTRYKGTKHLIVNRIAFEKIIKQNVHTAYATARGALYIVDPLGNVMMVYNTKIDPNGIYKDIKRLLKVSQIG